MRLRVNPASPFVRKVLVFAHETGLVGDITCELAQVWEEPADIVDDNPLGRVPALITPDGPLLDSLLCCDYLDRLHAGPRLIPVSGRVRWRELGWHTLANGVMEAVVTIVVERTRRPVAFCYPGQIERQKAKIIRALAAVAEAPPPPQPFRIAALTLACALGYLDFRLPELDWRAAHPGLAAFQAAVEGRASLQATRPFVSA